MLARGHIHFCMLFIGSAWLCINFSKCELCLTKCVYFLGLFWIQYICVSLPNDEVLEIHQLVLVLWQTQPDTTCHSLSGHVFLGKAMFCSNGCNLFNVMSLEADVTLVSILQEGYWASFNSS